MSEKQDAANRCNAQLSTGPKTPEGKVRAGRNATKYGFWSKDVLMPGEDAAEFGEFAADLRRDLNPVGAMECWCVEQVIGCAWRLRRVARVETELFSEQAFPEKNQAATPGRAYLNDCRGLNALAKLGRDESRLERSLYRAYNELRRLQASRAGQYVPPPIVADVDVHISPVDLAEGMNGTPETASDRAAPLIELVAGVES